MNYGGNMSSLSVGSIYPDSAYGSSDQSPAQAQSGGSYQPSESPKAIATALVTVILILVAVRVVYELAE